jgi:RNA ligase
MLEPEPFQPFAKIARFSRNIIITEKIDGTNAQIYITDDGGIIKAGSKNRWLEPGKADNFGFAAWVEAHKEELLAGLGPGRHYGEWWGPGIQRGYGHKEKRFSLFNVHRWQANRAAFLLEKQQYAPECCHVVPVLYDGPFTTNAVETSLERLAENGSLVSPGFMRPEGIVIFHTASGYLFKKTLENDESPKGAV